MQEKENSNERDDLDERNSANQKKSAEEQAGDYTDTQIHQVLAPITSLAKALTVDPEAETKDLANEDREQRKTDV